MNQSIDPDSKLISARNKANIKKPNNDFIETKKGI
jgi:hypothetical protein